MTDITRRLERTADFYESQVMNKDDDGEGHWVTLNDGRHVFIEDGETERVGESVSTTPNGKIKIITDSTHENEKYRVYGSDNIHWAGYDAEGNRVAIGTQPMTVPTPDELTKWDIQAKAAAQGTKEFELKYGIDTTKELYIRFGRPPKKGQSMNYLTHELEEGVSTYRGQYNVETGNLVFAPGSGTGGGLIPLMWGNSRSGPKTPYLISGDEVGFGSDGEPLLKNVKITHTLKVVENGFVISKKGK